MSKGSKIVPIRIPDELMKSIGEELKSRKDAGALRPISFSAWVRQAIKEKIAHAKRSRGKGRKPQMVAVDFDETGAPLYQPVG